MINVLIADDDETNRYLLRMFCREQTDLRLEFATNGREALDRIETGEIDILVADLKMPAVSGEDLFLTVKRNHPNIAVIIMTGYGSIEGAVDFLKKGADDYLTKPLTKEVFNHRLARLKEQVSLAKEVERLRESVGVDPLDHIIGRSPLLAALKSQLPTLAKTEASVVIYGESGTGKELVAHAIHILSKRSEKPFVTVNCGALPETLLESELFGHRRGAFTDAHRDTPGVVDAAHSGTLFLDEIGEISLGVQVKLLRFLESKEYKPLGSPKTKIADVRIVAATNRDLARAVDERTFREDLYYRLNILPVRLPALRDRTGDIPLLAQHFLDRFNRQLGKNVRLSPAAFARLERHGWPGNIRELENKIEHVVVMAPDDHTVGEQLQLGRDGTSAAPLATRERGTFAGEKKEIVARFEREYVTATLGETRGHVARAAERAGIDRKNFWQLMKKYGLRAETFR